MKINEIFIPGGFPKYTYNPRDQLGLEKQFYDYLDSGHKLLSLTGPTKSGKTVLCKKIIPRDKGLYISGGEIADETSFWEYIIDQLEIPDHVQSEVEEGENHSVSGTVTGGINVAVANLGGNTSTESSKLTTTRSQTSRSRNVKSLAIKALEEYKYPIIIDDFHYIQKDTQQKIIRALKSPIFEGLRVILLSVPHHANDATIIESEMTGRIQQLPIEPWDEKELMKIAKKGFPLLNVTLEEETYKCLAEESYGNPHLMQQFCLDLCKANNISETSDSNVSISFAPDKDSFFSSLTDKMSSNTDYLTLARGPRSRSDRIKRPFVNGEKADIYPVILHAIANTGPATEISYIQIRNELKELLSDKIPQLHEISRVLKIMEDMTSQSEGKPRILEWDSKNDTLYILDPFFAFYLRWAIRT